MKAKTIAHVRGALAISGLVGVVVAAACSSQQTSTGSANACATGARGFSRSRLQIADLSDFICDDPSLMEQARVQASTKRLVDTLTTQPDFNPDLAPSWTYPSTNTAGAPPEPITGTPAIYLPNYPSFGATDTLIFGGHSSTGPQLLAINNLYGAAPTSAWSATLGGSGMDGSWIEFDASHNVYVEDTTGTLWCFQPGNGAQCATWIHAKYPAGGSANGAQYTSPWWSFDKSAIYFADSAGNLTKVSQTTGNLVWTVNLSTIVTPMNSSGVATSCPGGCASAFAVRSSPIEYNGHIYVGHDGGAYFNITDPGSSAPTAANVQATWLCGSPVGAYGCNNGSTSQWSVVNAASIDVSKGASGYLYSAVAGSVYEWQLGTTNWYGPSKLTFFGGATLPVFSSPVLDRTNGNVYVGYNNSLYKITYPLAGTFSSVGLQGHGSNASYPHGTPLAYSGNVFVGDGAGAMEKYGCVAQANPQAPQLTGITPAYGTTIDSSPISDFSQSGIDFGYTSTSTGGVAQIAYSALNTCPGGISCNNGCGGAGTTICIVGGGCCANSDCPSAPTNGTYTCTSNQCVESCTSGTLCTQRNACIPSGQCCTNSDCASPATCNISSGQCISPADNVTLNLNYPANATIATINGNVQAPTTTLTTGTVAVSHGTTTVTGTGTTFTSAFSQSISAVTVTAGGAGYASAPAVTFSGGGCGALPAATASLAVSVAISNGGSGYTSVPTVTFTGGGCTTEPSGVASINGGGAVTAVTVWYPGVGCTSAPAVAFSGGGGASAAGTASFPGSVAWVTVTNGGAGCTSAPAVAFSGAGGATATAASGLSFSRDGSTWYEVASVASATSLTLATPYLGVSESGVATYYESDCNAALQNCNQGYPFTISNLTGSPTCSGAATCSGTAPTCNAVTCSTSATVGVATGAFSISVTAINSVANGSFTEASAILPNKLYVVAPTTTTAYLNMVRSFPIGSASGGVAATCPLQLAKDSSGNIWTVNSKGENSAEVCSGQGAVSNNISELVRTATPPYAATVIPNTVWGTGGAASGPEFIVGDSTGNVWFTVPGQTSNGVYEISNSNVTAVRTQYTPAGHLCYSPRGIDIDPNTTPNGVFVACGGQNTNLPSGARYIIHMDSNGNETAANDLQDYGAQPVALVYARAYTPGSGLLMNTDYHGNTELYVSRQSTSLSLITALEWNPNPLFPQIYDPCNAGTALDNTFTVSASDGNLYGLSYDSGGTPYASGVASGDVLNIEFFTNFGSAPISGGVQVACSGQNSNITNDSMNLDSNQSVAAPTPWGTANDDLFTYPIQSVNGNSVMIAGTNFYASHYTSNTVTRFGDGENKLNEFIVGSTSNPGPTGLLFDRTAPSPIGGLALAPGMIWVANSEESSLTQISKNLMLFTNQTNVAPGPGGDPNNGNGNYGAYNGAGFPGAGSACTATVAPGTNIGTIVGYGFDTSLANGSNNTVLLAGYMAPTVGVAVTGVPDGVVAFTVTAGGSGYTTAPIATLTGNCTTEPVTQATITGTMAIAVTNAGSGYTSAPTVSFTGGCTTEPTATATINGVAHTVTSVTVNSNGNGCTAPPTVVFTGGGGSNAAGTASISAGAVDGIRMQAHGSGCTNAAVPTVSFSGGGGGSGAAATLYWVDPIQTTLTVTVPNAPSGISAPVIVANQGGQVESYCTYTTR